MSKKMFFTTLFWERKSNQFSHRTKKNSSIHWNTIVVVVVFSLKCTCILGIIAKVQLFAIHTGNTTLCAMDKESVKNYQCTNKKNSGTKNNFRDKTVFRPFYPIWKFINKPKKQTLNVVYNCNTWRTLVAI